MTRQLDKSVQFHPAVANILRFFDFRHLPLQLQAASKPWAEQAMRLALANPDSPETSVALRRLLEAKDAAVRAVLPGDAQTICTELRSVLGM
jgi:hypothetical protein